MCSNYLFSEQLLESTNIMIPTKISYFKFVFEFPYLIYVLFVSYLFNSFICELYANSVQFHYNE